MEGHLKGHKLKCVVRFCFKPSNNRVEYEALLAGLRLSKEKKLMKLVVNGKSQLMVSQVNGNFTAKDKSIVVYLSKVMDSLLSLKSLS